MRLKGKSCLGLAALALLTACAAEPGPAEQNLGNDMLASAELNAFKSVDDRLGYRDARIAYDKRNCALYSATGPDGRPYSEPLVGRSGRRICTR